MSKKGIEFLDRWIIEHVTEGIKKVVDGDAASLSVEMVERLFADAEKAGLALDDLEPELGAPEVLIREALEYDEKTRMSPRELVERWVELFNSGDALALAELYHPDAVNHQVTQEPVEGREAIRAMFEREFKAAAMTCIPEAIHEAGNVVALEWRDPLGLRGCGFFTIRDERITFQRGYWDKLSFLKMHGLPLE